MCVVKGLECDYKQNNASWPEIKLPGPSELPPTRTPGHSFPAVYFLDSLVCEHGQVEIPRVNLSIPPYISEYIGGDPRAVSARFFETVHVWMPLISKKRFYDYLMNPLSQLSHPRADLTILIFCMKLINWSPVKQTQDKAKTPAYLAAKRILLAAELDGMLTLQILQASIIVLIYEVGHAIYPAAYMSVGSCAKYGLALGIDKQRAISSTASILDILEEEERRRAWWAIVVFDRFGSLLFHRLKVILAEQEKTPIVWKFVIDMSSFFMLRLMLYNTPEKTTKSDSRYVNLGCPERPLSTKDPDPSHLLPCDDADWEQGVVNHGKLFSVSQSADIRMGMFARLSQATCLLGHVFRHITEKPTNAAFHEEEKRQLDRTIRSLLNLSSFEGELAHTQICPQISICYSALHMLHDPARNRTDPNYVQHTLSLLRPVEIETSLYDDDFVCDAIKSVEHSSPLLLQWTYQAAIIYDRLIRVIGQQALGPMDNVKTKLRIMSRRWLAAEAYMQILEARDVTSINEPFLAEAAMAVSSAMKID
ncbi:hypothetical protein MMC30_003931 [Trapelia coarctata]|nr:hypothetical protein [Trapelia coarctata]